MQLGQLSPTLAATPYPTPAMRGPGLPPAQALPALGVAGPCKGILVSVLLHTLPFKMAVAGEHRSGARVCTVAEEACSSEREGGRGIGEGHAAPSMKN